MKMMQHHRSVIGLWWIIHIALVALTTTDARAQSDAIQTDVPAIKDVYAKDFSFGCLLSYRHVGFPTDPYVPGQSSVVAPNGGNLIKFHMNSMSPGNNMKPQYTVDISASAAAYSGAATQAARDSIEINPVVRFNGDLIAQLNWAKRQGFTFRGHTLVWHSQTPGTAFFRSGYTTTGARLTKEKMTQRMENYIKEVIRLIHAGWPGMLTAMDVVNEAVYDGSGSDRTTDSEWYVTFGDNSYLMKAFELARKYAVQYGETQMKLYYNDYNTHDPNKANGIVRILTPIFQAGFLDGIGMQDHDGLTSPTAAQWIASYNKFYPICTEMSVTEIDVNPGSGTPSASTLQIQANQYAMLFKLFVERSHRSGRGKIVNVSKDGLNDQHAFVANASLWDSNNKCKPAFYAVVDVGIHYNGLDSLITHANTLKQNEYTSASWSSFATALTSAKSARDQNYSATLSAAEGLYSARQNLTTAIQNLVKVLVSIGDVDQNLPISFALNQNFPNPFNPSTTIQFQLPTESFVTLKIFDMLGREVATVLNDVRPAGVHHVVWDGSGGASGAYLYRISTGDFVATRTMVLAR